MGYTTLPLEDVNKVLPINVSQNGAIYHCELNAQEKTVYSLLLYSEGSTIMCKQVSL